MLRTPASPKPDTGSCRPKSYLLTPALRTGTCTACVSACRTGRRDLEPEKTVLLEAGFDELNGVSWTKGCYMGQELTARTKYRGLVKRRLVPVEVDGPLPAPGTKVLHNGTEVGTMRSGHDGRGLAVLRLEALHDKLTCGDARLIPRIPAWMRLPELAA